MLFACGHHEQRRVVTVEPLPTPVATPSAPASNAPEPAKPDDEERMESHSAIDDYRAALNLVLPGLRRCYNDGLKSDPKMQGAVRLRIKVAADGSVADVAIDGPHAFPATVEQCMFAAVKSAAFPSREVTLVLPVNFVQPVP